MNKYLNIIKTNQFLLLQIAVGSLLFFLLVGWTVLNPSNIAWLSTGDYAQHYLGWVHFRNDSWSFPIGKNFNYGLEISSSIVYSDSIPLFAFIFKLFSSLLPEVFQYNGLWILLCFIFQAIFSWKIISLITSVPSIRLLASLFFIISPPMLWRLNGHESLIGHFLILAAIYIYLLKDNPNRLLHWVGLVFITTLIHAYLLAMVLAIWCASILDKIFKKELNSRQAIKEIFLIILVILFLMSLSGYFLAGAENKLNYFGYFSMNLLALIEPQNFSRIISNIPINPGNYEGNNYLGLGILLLLPIAIYHTVLQRKIIVNKIKQHFPLLITAILLTLFAISNKICFGNYCFEISLNDQIIKIANIFRASGRMFWPVYYLIYIYILYVIIKSFSNKNVIILFSLAFMIQIYDMFPGVEKIKQNLNINESSTWNTKFTDLRWEEIGKKYKKINWSNAGRSPYWKDISYFAARHKLGTNNVELARYDQNKINNAYYDLLIRFASGNYSQDTIYLLDDSVLELAEKGFAEKGIHMQKIDGFNVVLP